MLECVSWLKSLVGPTRSWKRGQNYHAAWKLGPSGKETKPGRNEKAKTTSKGSRGGTSDECDGKRSQPMDWSAKGEREPGTPVGTLCCVVPDLLRRGAKRFPPGETGFGVELLEPHSGEKKKRWGKGR